MKGSASVALRESDTVPPPADSRLPVSATVLPGPGPGESGRDERRAEQNEPDPDGEVPEAAGHRPDSGEKSPRRCMCVFVYLSACRETPGVGFGCTFDLAVNPPSSSWSGYCGRWYGAESWASMASA